MVLAFGFFRRLLLGVYSLSVWNAGEACSVGCVGVLCRQHARSIGVGQLRLTDLMTLNNSMETVTEVEIHESPDASDDLPVPNNQRIQRRNEAVGIMDG